MGLLSQGHGRWINAAAPFAATLLLLGALAAPFPVAARSFGDEERAERIGDAIERGIEEIVFVAFPARHLEWDGNTAVHTLEDGYHVIVPAFDVVLRVHDLILSVPSFELHVEPLADDRFTVGADLPNSVTVRGALGRVEASVAIEHHSLEGLLSLSRQMLMTRRVDALGVSFDIPDAQTVASLTRLTIEGVKEDRGRLIDQYDTIIIDGLRVTRSGAASERMSAGGIRYTTGLTGLRSLDWQAVMNSRRNAGHDADDRDDRRAKAEELTESLVGLTPVFDGTFAAIEVEGLEIEGSQGSLSIDRSALQQSIHGLRSSVADAHVSMQTDRLSWESGSEPTPFSPLSAAISLSIEDADSALFYEIFLRLVLNATSFRVMINEYSEAPVSLPMETISVHEFRVDTPEARLDATGWLIPEDADGARSTSGAATVEIAGFDAVIAALRKVPDLRLVVPVLTLMQALGQSATDEHGASVHRYEFSVEPDGRLLLNGTDFAPFLGVL